MTHHHDIDSWKTRRGEILTLRRLRQDDIGRSQAFLESLSYGTRYFRFGRGDFVYADHELQDLCAPARPGACQWVVTHTSQGREVIIGLAGYTPIDDGACCEFAVVIHDAWNGRGIGQRLMQQLIGDATSEGFDAIKGKVLGTNRRMIKFVEALGFELRSAAPGRPVQWAIRMLGAETDGYSQLVRALSRTASAGNQASV